MRASWLLIGLLSVGSASVATAHEGGPSRFNFRDHVRPLLEKRCGSCHRLGGAAPMTLLDYDEVVPWSRSMMIQVLQGTMPPWLPADGVGHFVNPRSLTAAEVNMLIDWSVGELPEGAEDIEPEPEPTPVWLSGEPDLVLRPEAAIWIEEEDEEKRHCGPLSLELGESRYAQAFEIKAGLPGLVQRATVYQSASCDTPGRPLFTWLPDQKTVTVSGGAGELLLPTSRLTIEILYRRDWDDEEGRLEDRTEVGVWFASTTTPVQSVHVMESQHAFPAAVELLAIYPDPTAPEEDGPIRVEVRTPDGEVQPLLVIERYEPLWREKYQLREPLRLEEGAEIRLSRPAAWIDFKTTE